MYIRTTEVTKGDKVYKYAQLVESVRRKSDGMVIKKVIANLGRLDGEAIDNWRLALEASKSGQRVVLAKQKSLPPQKAEKSLRYLREALFLELWRELGLDTLMSKLIPQEKRSVSPGDVIAALVIHRCVDPGSKLHATQWFPRTALPELLDVSPNALENTRLHRVLSQLDEVTPALMRSLPSRYRQQDAAFSALFMDVTDAWFYGHGPKAAQRGRCKDDVIRRMIGILLMCNEHGFPLRWSVMAGDDAETTAMLEQFRQLRLVNWAKDAPVVVDRALGRTSYLQQLLETGVPFLTALARPEIRNYVTDLPWQSVADVRLRGERRQQVRDLGACIEAEGFSSIDETLFVRDLGIVEYDPGESCVAQPSDPDDRCRFALQCLLAIHEAVEAKDAPSITAAGRSLGLSKSVVKKYSPLAGLTKRIQASVLHGEARGVALTQLLAISRLSPDEQLAKFKEVVSKADAKPSRRTTPPSKRSLDNTMVRLKVVAYFNPEMFLDQRDNARRKLERVESSVRALNRQLTSPRSRRDNSSVVAAVDRILRRDSLLGAFDVRIDKKERDGRTVFKAIVTLQPKEWARRRAFDGFSVLVTRPDCKLSARRLCQTYRNKDTVESDFRVIKSTVKLRPIWHHQDAKVRAHVTICMLALLLERTLRRKLGKNYTSEAALEHLADCRLDRYGESPATAAYLITKADKTQQKILEILGLEHLIDDEQMSEVIWPR